MLKRYQRDHSISPYLCSYCYPITAPFIFKGKIIKIVKEQINKNINAKLTFRCRPGHFPAFPRVSLALQDPKVIGLEQFSKDTLISAKEIDVVV